ncbi:hypothetical protein BpHYR1_039245 [Brachionus plicatilis]|uniref:Uncharacterized protein n=1 Tax=Brachionus plicatilis TaxID=10195 RepID=A0A3M7QUP9_BRAPC|nr:hypothetical protein BpHYR1_039245 [Brachionus plicatilis]
MRIQIKTTSNKDIISSQIGGRYGFSGPHNICYHSPLVILGIIPFSAIMSTIICQCTCVLVATNCIDKSIQRAHVCVTATHSIQQIAYYRNAQGAACIAHRCHIAPSLAVKIKPLNRAQKRPAIMTTYSIQN